MDDKAFWAEVGRRRAAGRRRVTATCEACGAQIEGTTRRRYCGPNCAARAFYEQHKAEVLTKRRERYRRQRQAQEAASDAPCGP